MLPGVGPEGEMKLLESHVAIIGCGALGTIAAMYLAGAGIGKITIADFDTIDISNLQRQLSFEETHVGQKKVAVLAEKLRAINSNTDVVSIDALVTQAMAEKIAGEAHFIIEATDNPASKYMMCDAAIATRTPVCIAGVLEFTGQICTYLPGHASYRDIFPEAVVEGGITPCNLGGVLGPLPGVAGAIQASEAIKYITGAGQLLIDRLLTFDLRNMQFLTLDF